MKNGTTKYIRANFSTRRLLELTLTTDVLVADATYKLNFQGYKLERKKQKLILKIFKHSFYYSFKFSCDISGYNRYEETVSSLLHFYHFK